MGRNAFAFLFINGGEYPFDTWECSTFWGIGDIPASDVSGSFSRGEFAMHTDLRTNRDFHL